MYHYICNVCYIAYSVITGMYTWVSLDYLFDAYLLRHNQRILDDYKNYIEEVKRIAHTYILKVLGVALGEQYAGCLHLKEQLLLVPT